MPEMCCFNHACFYKTESILSICADKTTAHVIKQSIRRTICIPLVVEIMEIVEGAWTSYRIISDWPWATDDGRLVASDRWLVFETLWEQSVPYSPSSEGVIEQLGLHSASNLHLPFDLDFSLHGIIVLNTEYIHTQGSAPQYLNHR